MISLVTKFLFHLINHTEGKILVSSGTYAIGVSSQCVLSRLVESAEEANVTECFGMYYFLVKGSTPVQVQTDLFVNAPSRDPTLVVNDWTQNGWNLLA